MVLMVSINTQKPVDVRIVRRGYRAAAIGMEDRRIKRKLHVTYDKW